MSFGAHVLLWVFPLILMTGVVVVAVVGSRKGEQE